MKNSIFFRIKFKPLTLFLLLCFFLSSSCGIYKKTDSNTPTNALERARKNLEEGRGASLGGLMNRGNTNFEFSTSNPLWRASLETLDFLPLTNVDYSGGLISTDWYSDNSTSQSLKITIRFLSNEINSTSLKIIIHERNCKTSTSCVTLQVKSILEDELRKAILSKASILEKESKNKKK